ncbi:MAG: hypothetical protein GQ577_03380, partial [Woeseiaceae bacterium]|nr:hypothetical protein [Woeseiaceae bacterium]
MLPRFLATRRADMCLHPYWRLPDLPVFSSMTIGTRALVVATADNSMSARRCRHSISGT